MLCCLQYFMALSYRLPFCFSGRFSECLSIDFGKRFVACYLDNLSLSSLFVLYSCVGLTPENLSHISPCKDNHWERDYSLPFVFLNIFKFPKCHVVDLVHVDGYDGQNCVTCFYHWLSTCPLWLIMLVIHRSCNNHLKIMKSLVKFIP